MYRQGFFDDIPTILANFEKRHDHVMDAIRNLISDGENEATDRNFPVSDYKDSTGRTLISDGETTRAGVNFNASSYLVYGWTKSNNYTMTECLLWYGW